MLVPASDVATMLQGFLTHVQNGNVAEVRECGFVAELTNRIAEYTYPERDLSELPPDPECMNDDRAEWAGLAVKAFAERVFHNPADREDAETVFGDLLVDLFHWADRHGVDFEEQLRNALRNYEEETLGEGEDPELDDEAEQDEDNL